MVIVSQVKNRGVLQVLSEEHFGAWCCALAFGAAFPCLGLGASVLGARRFNATRSTRGASTRHARRFDATRSALRRYTLGALMLHARRFDATRSTRRRSDARRFDARCSKLGASTHLRCLLCRARRRCRASIVARLVRPSCLPVTHTMSAWHVLGQNTPHPRWRIGLFANFVLVFSHAPFSKGLRNQWVGTLPPRDLPTPFQPAVVYSNAARATAALHEPSLPEVQRSRGPPPDALGLAAPPLLGYALVGSLGRPPDRLDVEDTLVPLVATGDAETANAVPRAPEQLTGPIANQPVAPLQPPLAVCLPLQPQKDWDIYAISRDASDILEGDSIEAERCCQGDCSSPRAQPPRLQLVRGPPPDALGLAAPPLLGYALVGSLGHPPDRLDLEDALVPLVATGDAETEQLTGPIANQPVAPLQPPLAVSLPLQPQKAWDIDAISRDASDILEGDSIEAEVASQHSDQVAESGVMDTDDPMWSVVDRAIHHLGIDWPRTELPRQSLFESPSAQSHQSRMLPAFPDFVKGCSLLGGLWPLLLRRLARLQPLLCRGLVRPV
ncbi:UNVERIFIED_CONTAM: hypothetical protein FKN15_043672 [Acipenser sinensis]